MATMQFCLIFLSIVVTILMGDLSIIGLKLDLYYTIIGSITAVLVSIPLAIISRYLPKYEPSFAPRDVKEFVIFGLILTPFGEELLFRGMLEGYLLNYAVMPIGVTIPAILFSLVHAVPFQKAPKKTLLYILISALVLGLIAGYFRAISGSIAPAVVTHMIFNAAGFLAFKRK